MADYFCTFCGYRHEPLDHRSRASGILTEGGDAKQAPGESLSSPTGEAGDAQEQPHD